MAYTRGLGVVLLMGFAGSVRADIVGPDCRNCFGGLYSLSATLLSGPGDPVEKYRVFYTLDLTQADPALPGAQYISAFAFKITSNLTGVSALAPVLTVKTNTQVNSSTSGCSGGGSGFVCVDGVQLMPKSSYTFGFDVTGSPGSFNLSDATIKANWDPASGLILSEKTSVPEGAGGLPFLVSGLGLVCIWRKWSAHRQSLE